MNYSNIKPIFALAALSFILTLSQYGSMNQLTNDPQSSINTGAVEQSPDDKSQFDSPEYNPTAGIAVLLSAGL